MWDELEGKTWLYRGVPANSKQAQTARYDGEIWPRRPDLTGADVAHRHTGSGWTESGYTSWSSERWIAEEFGRQAVEEGGDDAEWDDSEPGDDDPDSLGRIVVLRVLIADVRDQMEPGEANEYEWRLRGCVEGVELCEGDDDDEN